jgi:cytoskeletal protein RodZ
LESFGEKLRKQREHRGITLEAVANTTKISTRMLKALEDEHFDQLPGGVFNKGFVRAYARQIGLNEEEAVNDYLAALAESQVQSQPIVPNFRHTAAGPAPESAASKPAARSKSSKDLTRDRRTHFDRRIEARRTEDRLQEARDMNPHSIRGNQSEIEDNHNGHRREDTKISAPESHLAAHSYDEDEIPASPPSFLNLSAPSHPGDPEPLHFEPPSPPRHAQPTHWQTLAIPLFLLCAVIALWAFYRRNHAAREQVPTPPQPATSSAVQATAASAEPPKPSATSATTTPPPQSPQPAPAEPVSDVTKVVSPRAEPSKPKPPAEFTLVIRASETSWVAITADGQPVAQETLIAPANTSVRATHEIIVKTGNAAGVSFMLNGKDIPASGNQGEVQTYTFDANGLRDSPDASVPDTNN